MKMKIIYLDIEGCLRSGGRLTVNNLEGLAEIQRYQLKAFDSPNLSPLTICSGRGIGYIEAMLANIGFPPAGFWSVAENGAFVCDFRENRFELNPMIENVSEIQRISREIIPALLEKIGGQKESGKEICISLNPSGETSIEEYFQRVKKELSGFEKSVEITHSTAAVDITPRGVNKGTGLGFATSESGVELSKILYIGDSEGDFSAMEIAGFVACPANATEGCKELVQEKRGYISPYDDVKGVFDIIKHFTNYTE